MDEFIDELLREERSCDIILPRIQVSVLNSLTLMIHICQSTHLSINTSVNQHICQSTHLSINTSVNQHICQSTHLSINTSVNQYCISKNILWIYVVFFFIIKFFLTNVGFQGKPPNSKGTRRKPLEFLNQFICNGNFWNAICLIWIDWFSHKLSNFLTSRFLFFQKRYVLEEGEQLEQRVSFVSTLFIFWYFVSVLHTLLALITSAPDGVILSLLALKEPVLKGPLF